MKAIIRAFWLKFALYQQINIWGEILIRLSQPFMVGYLVRYLTQADIEVKSPDITLDNFYHSNQTNNPKNSSNHINSSNYSAIPMSEISGREYISHVEAIWYAVGLIVTSFAFAFSRHPAFVLCLRVANNVRTALTVMIYRKILKLSKSSFEQTDIGYTYLGVACVGGLVILILFIPFQGLMGRLFNTFRSRTTKLTDNRVRVMGEIISAMKLIKLYCWEAPFADNVAEIRE